MQRNERGQQRSPAHPGKVPAGLRKVDIPLPVERSRWLRPSGWVAGAAIVGLTSVFGLASIELNRNDPTAWQAAGPVGGHYWTVAKYQVAFTKFRLELNIAARGTVYPEDVKARGRELGVLLKGLQAAEGDAGAQLPAFAEAVAKLSGFQTKLDELFKKSDFKREDALLTLIELESMDSTLTSLVDRVGEEERRRRDAMLEGLQHRRDLLWMVLGGAWVVTVLWLGHAWRSMRRQAAADKGRRQALEAERRAVQAKEEALQTKSRFLSSVSHELRSSLQSISSALEMLKMTPGHERDGVLIGRIQRASDALTAQLRDLLTLARGEAGKLEMHPAPFEACELVEEVAADFRGPAKAKGLELVVETPPDEIYVVGDQTRIAQILTNLLSNAVKYTNAGSVKLKLHAFDRKHERLTLEVRDTGPGIPKQLLGNVFEQYERLGGVDRTSESAGVGLAVVKTVAALLGASIRVDSREGVGTEFVVMVPVTPERDEGTEKTVSGAAQVLIVDDREDVLEGLADVARSLGYAADTASSAALAANRMAAKKYDVVLIDLDMPEKGGHELASETKRGSGLNRGTRLVAISAADSRRLGIKPGWPFEEFAQKPIERRALQRLVEASRQSRVAA
ncbi:ATP-binding response regulator (plasmid) [Sphaerotilaceae bacterium SBD11-9]